MKQATIIFSFMANAFGNAVDEMRWSNETVFMSLVVDIIRLASPMENEYNVVLF